jgi:hypothetical protein
MATMVAGTINYFNRDEKPTQEQNCACDTGEETQLAQHRTGQATGRFPSEENRPYWSSVSVLARGFVALSTSQTESVSSSTISASSKDPDEVRQHVSGDHREHAPIETHDQGGDLPGQSSKIIQNYDVVNNYFIKPEASETDTSVTPRKRASSAGSEFSPSLLFRSWSKIDLTRHFEVLGMTISLEQIDSEDEDEKDLSMEMNCYNEESSIDKYRRAIKEYYAKELENNMIMWKRTFRRGTYIEYLKHAVPENICFSDDGQVEWIDPRTERVKRTFDRVEPTHALHVLGEPPMPDEVEDHLVEIDLESSGPKVLPRNTQLRRAHTVPLPQKKGTNAGELEDLFD